MNTTSTNKQFMDANFGKDKSLKRLFLLAFWACLLCVSTLKAQTTFSWRNDQSPANNASWLSTSPYYFWNGTTGAVPGGGEILFFDGSAGTTMTNNLTVTSRYRISFGSTSAASRTIGGSTSNAFYDFSGAIPAIVNSSGVTHTINFPFTVGNTSTATSPQYGMEVNASSGDLTIGSTISATNATGTKVLVLRASSSGTGTITLSGVVSNGSGTMSITKMESNTAILSAANTYTGATSITGGTLRLSGSGTLGTGSDVRISSGATLDLNGVNATVGSIAETGSSNGGVVTLGAGTLTINGASKGTLYQNSISGTGGLTMAGSGTTELVLYGTQSYSGTTTVSGGKLSSSVAYSSTNYSITGGTLQLNAANIIPDASTMTLGGGTFSTGSSAGYGETLGALTVSANSTIALGTGAHTLTFANSSASSWTAGTTLTITGWAGTYNGTSNGTTGKIFFGSNASGLTAQQISRIVFNNGTNNFSAILLSTGELVPSSNIIVAWTSAGASTAWYTNTNWTPSTSSAQWTTSNIAQFNNTGTATTAGINAGTANLSTGAIDVTNNRTRALTIGSSSATVGTVTLNGATLYGLSNTVLSNNSSSLFTFQDNETGTGKTMGLVLGNGTSNNINILGSGGITISSIISGTSKNLTKEGTGSGVLTLSGANTYGGTTTINGGTLKATVSGALPSTTALTLANTSGVTLDLTTASVAPTIASLAGGGSSGGNITFSTNTGALTVGDASSTSYSGLISGSGAIVKVGAGVLTFGNAANTYTGSTTITGGELRLNPSSTTATLASQIILNGGKLGTTSIAASTTITNSSTLKLNANSTIYLGSNVHSLKFADCSAISWPPSTTLTIFGWTGTGGASGTAGKIYFGAATGTLTSTQLSQISFDGYTGIPILLSTGELVPPVPKPVLSTPTATVTSSTSATLGATITSNGGASITARGTAYKTSSPVAASDNQLAEGATSVAAFSHSRTGLSAQTLYYYVGYAISGTTGISGEGSFRTWSNPPTAQPTSFTASPANASITINWNTATYPSTGATKAGYLLLYSTGTPALVASPNGTAPGSAISTGTQISVTETSLPTAPALTASVSSLSNGTAYNFLLVPYTWDGTNATTYNYLTASALTVSATPLAPPTVTTTVAASSITTSSASSGGQTITGTSITAKGVVWNTTASPTLASNLGSTNDGTGTSNFSSSITALSAETQYNVRAYATNVGGTGYGTNVSFYTLSNEPTAAASSFSASANGSAQVDLSWTAATFPGSGATATGYIVLRRTDATDPATTNVTDGVAPASLSLPSGTTLLTTITSGATASYSNTGLLSSQQYNYIIIPFTWDGSNAATYNYYLTSAPTSNATTAAGFPSVVTNSISSISQNSANSGGNTLTTGGSSITDKGVVWATSSTPTLSNSYTSDGTGTADYSSSLTGLSAQTLYYVRAYVTNTSGTSYGNEVSFRTFSAQPTAQASSASATVNGAGSISVSFTAATFPSSGATQAGYAVVYAAGTTPTLSSASGTAPSAGTGTLLTITPTNLPSTPSTSISITGLTAGVSYNVMIVPFTWDGSNASTYNYLTTSAPTASVTAVSTPSVTTTTAGSTTSTSASSGGSAIDAASGNISAKGVVWGLSANPTISSNSGITSDGTGTGSYSSSLTGLSAQTLYNYRAYVTNEVATAYGSNLTFRTLSTPPSSQASSFSASTSSSTAINLNWSAAGFPGSGATTAGYVLLRATSPNTPSLGNSNGAAPSAGTNTTIVSSSIASGSTSSSSTGLTAATTYNYLLIPFTWDGTNATTYNYLTTSAATASATTFATAPSAQAISISYSAVTATTITTSWVAAAGSPAGYIVLRGTAAPNTDPTPGTTYTAGNTIGNASVVYVGSGTSTGAQTSLVDGTTYYYEIFTYNGSGSTTNYNVTSPLAGNQATTTITAPTAAAASSITSGGFTASWSAVTGAASYQLDVYTAASSVTSESFENSLTNFTATTGTATYYSGSTSSTADAPASSPYATLGTYGLGLSNGTTTITSSNFNTSSAISSSLNFNLASLSVNSTANGADAADIVTVSVSPDGGTTWYSTLRVIGNANARWAYNSTGVASTSYDGDNTPVDYTATAGASNGYSDITINNLPISSNLKVRITLLNDNANERWVIDNFTLNTNTVSFVSGYNNLSVSGTSQAVTGLSANTTYYYRVRTVGVNTTSANSTAISFTTLNDITTAAYRSAASGDWNGASVWEYNSTGATYTATSTPPSATNNVTIQNGHTIALVANITNTGKTITVNSGGVLNTSTYEVSGTGNVTISSGAGLTIAHADGIASTGSTGAIQVSGTRSFSTGANYTYNGSAAQTTGSGLTGANNLTINNAAGVGLSNNASVSGTLTLTSGAFNIGSSNILTVAAAGTIAGNGGSIGYGTSGGTVSFSGAGTINGSSALTFNNLTINTGALTLTTVPTIGGTFQINGGNVTAAPKYGSSSTLYYNVTYGRYLEWSATGVGTIGTTAGYPNNVTINTGSFDVYNAASAVSRAMAGTLTINNGATLTCGAMNATFTIGENVAINNGGTLNMSTMSQAMLVAGNVSIGSGTSGTLTLSSVSGGDIKVGGNWTRNTGATFTPNIRAVFFTGSGTNVINTNGSFDYLVSEKTGGSIQLGSALTLTAPNTGNAMSLKSAASFDLNGYNLNLTNATASTILADGGVVNINGSTSTINLSSATKTIAGVNGGTVVFGSNITLITSTGIDFGSGISTVNGTFQINSGGFVSNNPATYGSAATLKYNSGTTYGRNLEWSANSGAGYPFNVEVASGTTLDLSANGYDDRSLAGSLNLIGSLSMGAMNKKLTVASNITIGGTLTLSSAVGGDIYVGGNWTRTGTLVHNTRAIYLNGASGTQLYAASGGETLDYLFINKAAGTVELQDDLTINQSLTLTSGALQVNSAKTLTLGTNQISGSGSLTINGTLKTSRAAGFSGTNNTAVNSTISSITLGASSTIDYTAGSSQTITGFNYVNLSNSGNGIRTLSNSGTIGVSGTFSTGTGTYYIGTSTVEFNGSSAQSIPALSVASGANYNNLTLNNSAGASLAGNVSLKDALSIDSGTLDVNGKDLILLSTVSQTARIAPITSGGISGNVTMQRFVPGGAAGWAFLGMPLSGRTIADWTDDFTTSGFSGSTTGTGAFKSIYTYDETASGVASSSASYVPVSSSTNSVDPRKGYFVFMGDNASTVADKNIDVTGPILSGNQDLNVVFTSNYSTQEDGWNLVSNPYCSAIDWLSPNWGAKTNIDDAVYIYNPDNAQYLGTVGGVSFNGGNEIIGSSQAFWVHANAASPSLIAAETVKSSISPGFYKATNATAGVLRMQLDGLGGQYSDEAIFRTKQGASFGFDPNLDAYKLLSMRPDAPNIFTKMNGLKYVINAVEALNSNFDLPLFALVNTAGNYSISFKGLSEFSSIPCLTLEDKLTHSSIDLHIDSTYSFVSAIDTSVINNRFVLHFGIDAIVPSASLSSSNLSIPSNNTVVFTNTSSGAFSYVWNFGDNSPADSSANPSHTYAAAGVYTVTLLASNGAGCSQSTSYVVTVDNVTGIQSNVAEGVANVVKDAQWLILNYNFSKSTRVKINLFNTVGQLVSSPETMVLQSKGGKRIELAELPRGLYTIELLFDSKRTIRKIEF